MSVRRLLPIVFAVAFAGSSSAAELVLAPRFHSSVTPPARFVVHLRPVNGGAELVQSVAATGDSIPAETGAWELRAEAGGYYSAPISTEVTASSSAVTIDFYPAVLLRGTLQTGKGDRPRELTAEVRPVVRADERQETPNATVTCRMNGDRFSCLVPAGLVDLRIGAPGFVPFYRWNVDAPPSQLELGAVALKRGSSFTGDVAYDEKSLPLNRVRVIAKRDSSASVALRERLALDTAVASPNARGRFSMPLAPGDYIVQAALDGLVSDARPVHVVDGSEAQLREPLILHPPRRLTLHADPPLGPGGKPWFVRLMKQDRNGVIESSIHDVVSLTGEWQRAALAPGSYVLVLSRIASDDDAWFRQNVEMSGDTTVDAHITYAKLIGQLTIAGKPLDGAHLTLTSVADQREVRLRSRADGSFPAIVPAVPDGRWTVDIRCDKPFVRRTVEVTVTPEGERHVAHVAIDLPGTTLAGVLVDRRGELQREGLVDVEFSDGTRTQIEVQDGSFSIVGATPGTILLQARTATAATRHPVEVELRESNDLQPLQLEVAPFGVFEGVVESADGAVSEAVFSPLQIDPRGAVVARLPVDPDGHFRVPIAPGSNDFFLLVSAPGYAARILRPVAQPDPPAPVFLSPLGGSLHLNIGRSDRYMPFLIHDRALFPALPMTWVIGGSASGSAGVQHRNLDLMEPGVYALCWFRAEEVALAATRAVPADPARCSSGVLAAGATLTLDSSPAPE
jgi:hypothetical protein